MPVHEIRIAGRLVPPIGLGCMGFSGVYGHAEHAESVRTIRAAHERGVRLFDTADVYGAHGNEELVGEALRGYDDVVVATKVGLRNDDEGRFAGLDGSPGHIRAAVDGSLRRLGRERVDLYYLHRLDPRVPVEDSAGALAELVRAGKVAHVGFSEVSTATVERARAVVPVSAVQTEYSLWSRGPERALLPALGALGVPLVAYSPLGRGFLTGTVRSVADLPDGDYRRSSPRFDEDNLARNLAIVDRLRPIADEAGLSLPQLALAWVLARPEAVVALVGTRRVANLDENLAALDAALGEDVLGALDAAAPAGAASGERYPTARMYELDDEA